MSSENHFPTAARPFGLDLNNAADCCGDSAFKSPSLNRKLNQTQFKNTSSEKQYFKQTYLPQSGRKFGENILNIGENALEGGFSLYRCATDKKDSVRNSIISSNKGVSLQTGNFQQIYSVNPSYGHFLLDDSSEQAKDNQIELPLRTSTVTAISNSRVISYKNSTQ